MSLYDYSSDGQDPKVIQKVLGRLRGLLLPDEKINYVAIQKKPGLNLFADAIVMADQHLFLCEQTKMGLDIVVEVLPWDSIQTINLIPENQSYTIKVAPKNSDTTFIIDYIPFIQGEKIKELIQATFFKAAEKTASEDVKPDLPKPVLPIKEEPRQEIIPVPENPVLETPIQETPIQEASEQEDPRSNKEFLEPEIREVDMEEQALPDPKIKRLESLYYRQLITKKEFEDRCSMLIHYEK